YPKIYPLGYLISTIGLTVIAYAILRHQLLDIKIVIEKGLVYSGLLASISLIYITCIFTCEQFVQSYYGYHSFPISMLIAIFLGIILIPLRNRIQVFVDRLLYKGSTSEIAKKVELLEREVAEQEKFKAIATLASGMAHEIKNPLTAIKIFSEFLPERMEDKEFLLKFSKIVGNEVKRIDDIITQLLDFSKPAPINTQPTDIHSLIDDTLDFLNSKLIYKHIDIKKHYAPNTLINIDKNQIRQCLLNLFLNAIDAMPNGGSITITTLSSHALKTHQPTFQISIQDTGIGIAKDKIKNIFNPFYTQKDTGTGLGLAITKGIIEEHGGEISVESIKGKTVFTVVFKQ
ncbi:MAG: signal transduction histidine kinase, partial [Candidatus Omnitrophota bacterium]